MKKKIAIVGGGFAGMGAAYELARAGHTVTIYERSAALGGLAGSLTVGGEPLEQFYHHMFPTYHDFWEVAKEIGVGEMFYFKKAKTANYYEGKMHPFTSGLDLLRFSPISFFDRIRSAFLILYLKFNKNWKSLEKHTAYRWFKKYFGSRVFAVLWKPLLDSKFGAKAETVGAVWLWGRIYERPKKFGYMKGGFKTLVIALETHLQKKGVRVFTKTAVSKITKNGATFSVQAENREELYDHVIIAAPPVPFLSMAKELLPVSYAELLQRLSYQGTICAVLILKKHISPYYWTNIIDKRFPFTALVEQTHFVPENTYGGLHPVYLAEYLSPEDDLYKKSDEDIWKVFLPALSLLNTDFREDWIVEKHMFRAPYTQPVIPANYKPPMYETPVGGLWWVSMSHIYPWDRGTDHAFRSGRELARALIASEHA